MKGFSLKQFAEFEAIAIGAGEYGEALEVAKPVAKYEKMKLEERKRKRNKIKKL